MKVSIDILLVTIPYTYKRGKVTCYQRPVPRELAGRYSSKPGDYLKPHEMEAAKLLAELS